MSDIATRLGLQKSDKRVGRVRQAPKKFPKREGPVWGSVTVVQEHATTPSVECKNCSKKFCGGSTRIREHIIGTGVIECCPCVTDSFLDLKQSLLEKTVEAVDAKRQKISTIAVDEASEEKPHR